MRAIKQSCIPDNGNGMLCEGICHVLKNFLQQACKLCLPKFFTSLSILSQQLCEQLISLWGCCHNTQFSNPFKTPWICSPQSAEHHALQDDQNSQYLHRETERLRERERERAHLQQEEPLAQCQAAEWQVGAHSG